MSTPSPQTIEPPKRRTFENIPNSRAEIRHIAFFHPFYNKLIFNLPCVDRIESQDGVHYGTALVACQIIANNSFDNSFLAKDLEGTQRVTGDHDQILTEERYYFFVGNFASKSSNLQSPNSSPAIILNIIANSSYIFSGPD